MDLDCFLFGLVSLSLDLGAGDFLPFIGEIDGLSLGSSFFVSSKVSSLHIHSFISDRTGIAISFIVSNELVASQVGSTDVF